MHAVGRTRYNGLQVHEQHAMTSAAVALVGPGGGAESTTGVTPSVATDAPPVGYLDRKLDNWCTYGACKRRAADGYQLCSQHRARVNTRKAKRARRVREQLAADQKCIRCRKPSKTYRCPACRVLDCTNLPSTGVTPSVATIPDPWRRDKDGWERYRGKGKRGAPPAALNDEADLRRAFEALERGRNAIAYARSAAVAELPRIQKQDALAAATSILAMSAQFTWSVVERNRVPDPRVVGARAQVREALGAGVDPEMLDDALIDRVIAAVRRAA